MLLAMTAAVAGAVAAPACDGGGAATPSAAEREGVVAEAEAAIAGFFEATNAIDTERLLGYYQHDDELVQVACTTVRRGFSRVEPVIRMWHGDRPDIALQHEVVRTTALGRDAAVVAAQGRNQQGEALFWTFVLRRSPGGEWLVVQEHQSWAGCREPRVHLGSVER